MDVTRELRYLGFTSNESAVYLALLRIDMAGASRIAREAGIERSSTYNALKRLVKDGLVASVFEDGKKRFFIDNTDNLSELFREKGEHAELLVPKLKEMRKFEREKERVVKYRGYTGVKAVLYDVLNTCGKQGEYLIFGSEGQLSDQLPVYAKIFVSKKDRMKIRARILLNESMRSGKPFSKLTTARYLPDYVMAPASTNVYGDKVAIILWSDVPEAVIIDDPLLAKSYRSYFEFMWKKAKL